MSTWRSLATAFGAGTLFGLGLVVSGMTDPTKVQGFLDLAGPWDPSLAFVMGSAIPVAAAGFALARRWGIALHVPTRGIDAKLLGGSLAFGVGWGLGGFCPGPALVSLGAGSVRAGVFVAAMVVGMVLHELLARRSPRPLADEATLPSLAPPPST